MHKILTSFLLSLALTSFHAQSRDLESREEGKGESYGTFKKTAITPTSLESSSSDSDSENGLSVDHRRISGIDLYRVSDLPPKLTKRDLHRIARPQEHEERASERESGFLPSSIAGMSRTEDGTDPWYIKEQRALIAGKTLTVTGVLLFKSYDLPGKIITGLTYTDIPHEPQKWSHAGLLLEDEHAQEYCFESTGSAGQIFSGMLPQVQIHTLEKAVETYAGDVGLRRIAHDTRGDSFKQDTQRATELVWDWVGVSYEKRPLELVQSIAGWNKYHKDSEKSLFCSEMDALMLQQLGYLPYGTNAKPASNYIPRNFGASDVIELLHGRLEDIKILKTYAEYQADHPEKGCCTIL